MKFSLPLALLPIVAEAFSPSDTVPSRMPVVALVGNDEHLNADNGICMSRKLFFNIATIGASLALAQPALALENGRPESVDIDNFLRTGTEAFPMGVSSQAGKSKPVTGVFLRDGTAAERDTRTGNVLAEIVLGDKADLSAVLVSFQSPWALAKGSVFDVECRDKDGDNAFLSVTEKINGKTLEDIPSSFYLDQLFAPTGRFSFYGSPTNLKVKKSQIVDNKRIIEFSFSQLSQATNAEIPRQAIMVASKPGNTDQAVMLVASATSTRWKRGSENAVRDTIASFNASPSPRSALKVRRRQKVDDFL
jgi:hypothetical protein